MIQELNPKDAIGRAKLDLGLVPDTLEIFAATAFAEGADKYGPYNWRRAPVAASAYYAAGKRHQKKWWNGQDLDVKTKVHHLANAIACLAIVLDAEVCGTLVDDRPTAVDLDHLILAAGKIVQDFKRYHRENGMEFKPIGDEK